MTLQPEWWHIGGLLMAIVQAAYLLINQHFRIEPRLLMLWRGFGTAALLLPASLWLGPPAHPAFYILCTGAGLCVGIFDRLLFEASRSFGAGVTSRLLALTVPVAFMVWLILHPGHLAVLAGKPFILLLPAALLGLMASALMLKRDPVSRTALTRLMPMLLMGAGIDVLNKSAMTIVSGWPAFVTYGVVTATTSGLLNLLWTGPEAPPLRGRDLLAPPVVKGGLAAVGIVTTFLLLKTSSLAGAPNPAFVTALGLMAPVWVLAWNRWHKVPDSSSLWAGFGCVISALLLVLSTL